MIKSDASKETECEAHAFGNIFTVVLLLAVLSLLGVVIWSLPRGLDLGDEAYSLLTYAHPKQYMIVASGAAYLVHFLFSWMSPSILAYREARLGLTLLGSIVFWFGIYRWYVRYLEVDNRHLLWSSGAFFLYLLAGNLTTHFVYPQILHYNSITNFLLLCASAGVFYHSATYAPERRIASALVLSGLCAALEVFVKLPSGVLLIAAVLFFIPALIPGFQYSVREYVRLITPFIAGLLLGAVFYFAGPQHPLDYYRQIVPFMLLASRNSHALSWLLPKYAAGILTLFLLFLKYGAWFPFLWLMALGWGETRGMPSWLQKALLWLFPVVVFGFAVVYRFIDPYFMFAKIYWVLLCMMFAWCWLTKSSGIRRNVGFGLAFLFVLPFIGAFGTGIGLVNNVYTVLASWFALAACLTGLIYRQVGVSRPLAVIFVGLMVLFSFTHAWVGMINPENSPGINLWTQTEQVHELPALGELRVDKAMKQSLLRIHSMLESAGFKLGDPVLTFYNLPGLPYAMGGVPYGEGYYINGLPTFDKEDCYFLGLGQAPNGKLPFMIQSRDPSPAFSDCLLKQGIDPQNYRQIGTVAMQDSRWKVFAPISQSRIWHKP